MKRQLLRITIFILLIVISAGWFLRTEYTIYLDNRQPESRTVIGPGQLMTVSHGHVGVSWMRLAVFLLGGCALSLAIVWIEERAAGDSVAPLRWIVRGTAVVIVLALVVAVAMSRYYWGYYFARPAPRKAIEGFAVIKGISSLRCDSASGPLRCRDTPDRTIAEELESCRQDSYYCLGGRIAVALRDANLLPTNPAAPPAAAFRHVERVLRNGNIFVRSEAGYDGNRVLTGVVAVGETRRREPVLAFGLEGAQISNDHVPYYEVLASIAHHEPRLIGVRVFFYDVAGVEGLEWPYAFLGAALLGLTVWLPIALIAAAVAGLLRRPRLRV